MTATREHISSDQGLNGATDLAPEYRGTVIAALSLAIVTLEDGTFLLRLRRSKPARIWHFLCTFNHHTFCAFASSPNRPFVLCIVTSFCWRANAASLRPLPESTEYTRPGGIRTCLQIQLHSGSNSPRVVTELRLLDSGTTPVMDGFEVRSSVCFEWCPYLLIIQSGTLLTLFFSPASLIVSKSLQTGEN